MGRLRKYNTKEESKEAQRQFARNYYWKNKVRLDNEARERYQNKIKSKKNELREDL